MSQTELKKQKLEHLDHEIITKEAILTTLRADIKSKQSFLDSLNDKKVEGSLELKNSLTLKEEEIKLRDKQLEYLTNKNNELEKKLMNEAEKSEIIRKKDSIILEQQEKIKQFEDQIVRIVEKYQHEKIELENKTRNMSERENELQLGLNELVDKIKSYEKEMEEKTKIIEKTVQEKELLSQKSKERKSLLVNLNDQLGELQKVKSSLESEKKLHSEKNFNLQDDLEAKQKEISDLKDSYSLLEKNKNDSYILLEKNFANLEKEHEALKVKYSELEKELFNSKNETLNTKQDNALKEKNFRELQEKYKYLQIDHEKQVNNLKKTIQDFEQSNIVIISESNQVNEKLEACEIEKSNFINQLKSLQTENNILNEKLLEYEKKDTTYTEKIKEISHLNEGNITRLNEEFAKKEAQYERKLKEKSDKLLELQADLHKRADLVTNLQNNIKSTFTKNKALSDENLDLKKKMIPALEETIEKKELETTLLKDMVKSTQSLIRAREKEIQTLKSKVSRLERQLERREETSKIVDNSHQTNISRRIINRSDLTGDNLVIRESRFENEFTKMNEIPKFYEDSRINEISKIHENPTMENNSKFYDNDRLNENSKFNENLKINEHWRQNEEEDPNSKIIEESKEILKEKDFFKSFEPKNLSLQKDFLEEIEEHIDKIGVPETEISPERDIAELKGIENVGSEEEKKVKKERKNIFDVSITVTQAEKLKGEKMKVSPVKVTRLKKKN